MSNDSPSGLQTDLDLGGDFREARGATAAVERSVSATARAELANKAEWEMALDRHEEAWVRERERLSGKALPTPSFDLGAQQGRDLQAEYEQRRTAWTQQQAGIEEHYESRRTQIRINGRTVKDEFTESSHTSNGPNLQKAFNREAEANPRLEQAKAVQAPTPAPALVQGRGRGR